MSNDDRRLKDLSPEEAKRIIDKNISATQGPRVPKKTRIIGGPSTLANMSPLEIIVEMEIIKARRGRDGAKVLPAEFDERERSIYARYNTLSFNEKNVLTHLTEVDAKKVVDILVDRHALKSDVAGSEFLSRAHAINRQRIERQKASRSTTPTEASPVKPARSAESRKAEDMRLLQMVADTYHVVVESEYGVQYPVIDDFEVLKQHATMKSNGVKAGSRYWEPEKMPMITLTHEDIVELARNHNKKIEELRATIMKNVADRKTPKNNPYDWSKDGDIRPGTDDLLEPWMSEMLDRRHREVVEAERNNATNVDNASSRQPSHGMIKDKKKHKRHTKLTPAKVTAIILALLLTLGIGYAAITGGSGGSGGTGTEITGSADHGSSGSDHGVSDSEILGGIIAGQELSLEDLKLTVVDGVLTEESIQALSKATMNELNEFYSLVNGETPKFMSDKLLTSLTFIENGHKPEHSGTYAGLGQIGVPAIRDVLAKLDKNAHKVGNDCDNYYYNMIHGKSAEELHEIASTDAKVNMALTAMSLCDVSDRNWTAFGENPYMVLTSYNAGEGIVALYEDIGLFKQSSDHKHITVDLSKASLLIDNTANNSEDKYAKLKKFTGESGKYAGLIMDCIDELEANEQSSNPKPIRKVLDDCRKKWVARFSSDRIASEAFTDCPGGLSYIGNFMKPDYENEMGR